MIYLLALIGLVTLAVLFWKAFGPTAATAARGPGSGAGGGRGSVRGPDDDPEFLWRVERDTHRRQSDHRPGSDTPPDPEG
ncbi:hypothetical protein ERC79_06760 [Rhodococcus sp. ABRD24]|uniref:hypothetical protein n=1 Tax=Rhodococcus sp. ABRD24 TaxID=2507582 RepID=UPI0010392CF2|nr:hypothetical protein [Rhodococcus sp. ABRD24]QBJ95701.1 hypothetical protein ERC79_06760 [Rhodococcus sp. ABRD24]